MSAQKQPLLLATAIAYGVLSLGHTTKGLEQFKHPSLAQVPAVLRETVKTGWYEGSVFFAVAAVLNYKYTQTGLVDIFDKTIVALLSTLLFGAGAKYFKAGDKGTAGILAVVGVLQTLGAKAAL